MSLPVLKIFPVLRKFPTLRQESVRTAERFRDILPRYRQVLLPAVAQILPAALLRRFLIQPFQLQKQIPFLPARASYRAAMRTVKPGLRLRFVRILPEVQAPQSQHDRVRKLLRLLLQMKSALQVQFLPLQQALPVQVQRPLPVRQLLFQEQLFQSVPTGLPLRQVFPPGPVPVYQICRSVRL